MNSNPNSSSTSKYWRSAALRIGGSVLILALLLRAVPFRLVWSKIQLTSPWLAVALLCSYLALHLMGTAKWRLLINLAGAELTFPQAVRCYFTGLFGNIFLPSLVGGDILRAGIAFRLARSKTAVVLGSLVDRVQDTIGLLAVVGIGVLLLPNALDPRSRGTLRAVAVVFLVGVSLGVGSVSIVPVRRFPWKIRRRLVPVRHAIRAVYRRPALVFLCFCMGMTLQVCLVSINFILGKTSGLHVPFYVWLFAWPLSKLSGLIPVTQGGMGIREAALVGLLLPFGAPKETVTAVGFVFEAILISGGLIGGAMAFVIGRISSGTNE